MHNPFGRRNPRARLPRSLVTRSALKYKGLAAAQENGDATVWTKLRRRESPLSRTVNAIARFQPMDMRLSKVERNKGTAGFAREGDEGSGGLRPRPRCPWESKMRRPRRRSSEEIRSCPHCRAAGVQLRRRAEEPVGSHAPRPGTPPSAHGGPFSSVGLARTTDFGGMLESERGPP